MGEEEKKELETLWKEKKKAEESLEIQKEALQEAEESNDDFAIENNAEMVKKIEEEIQELNNQIDDILRNFVKELQKSNNEKKKSKNRSSDRKARESTEVPESEKDNSYNKENAQILIDIENGKYLYKDKNIQSSIDVFSESGEETLDDEFKEEFIDTLIVYGIDEKDAEKVDPYIYCLLRKTNPEKAQKYVDSIKDNTGEIEGIEIIYDLRTKEDGRKKKWNKNFSFLQKHKMKKIAKFHKKNNLAKVLINKSKAKLYGLLAGIGLMSLVAGNKVQDYVDTNKTPIESETDVDHDISDNEPDIVILDEEQVIPETEQQTEQQIQTETEIPTEQIVVPVNKIQVESEETKQNETEKQKVDNGMENTEQQETTYESMVGKRVKVEIGTHEYNDPYDAVKEQLNLQVQNEVTSKNNNKDLIYKVTMEGLYCPDGRCVEIAEKEDLVTAMRQNGIDETILKNINTEELKEQGYKYMLHVEATGIQTWIEASSAIQVDRAGIPIPPKTQANKEINSNQSQKDIDASLESR